LGSGGLSSYWDSQPTPVGTSRICFQNEFMEPSALAVSRMCRWSHTPTGEKERYRNGQAPHQDDRGAEDFLS
jgi:hypothetical protein